MIVLLSLLAACSDVEDAHSHDDHNHGVIDTIELSFAPQSGGDAIVFEYHDGEGDEIVLVNGEDYDLSLSFADSHGHSLNAEILDDATAHQIFFMGEGVDSDATGTADGILSIDYADEDEGGLPLGLDALASVSKTGSASLRVVLRHLPPENDVDVKVAGLAETVAADGLAAIGGDNDADVTFDVTVTE